MRKAPILPSKYMTGYESYYKIGILPDIEAIRLRHGWLGKVQAFVDGPLSAYPEIFPLIVERNAEYLRLDYEVNPLFDRRDLQELDYRLDDFPRTQAVRISKHLLSLEDACSLYLAHGDSATGGGYAPLGLTMGMPLIDQEGILVQCKLPRFLKDLNFAMSNSQRVLEEKRIDLETYGARLTGKQNPTDGFFHIHTNDQKTCQIFVSDELVDYLKALAMGLGPVTIVVKDGRLEMLVWVVHDPYELYDHSRNILQTAKVIASRMAIVKEMRDWIDSISFGRRRAPARAM